MKTIQDYAAWHAANRYRTTFARLDPRRQLTVLLDVLGASHMHRAKTTGHATKKARAYVCHMAIKQLKASGYAVKNLLNLDDRHVSAILNTWAGQGLSASTMATRISILRWLTTALGKHGLVRDPCHYGLAAEDTHRPQVATEDRSWCARGIDTAGRIKLVGDEDAWVGIQLEMSRAFGLRLTESLLIKPRSAHSGDALRVEEGTKGGRTRIVPIRTETQREVLERAKKMGDRTARGNLVPPRRTPSQARQRVYYLCRKHGITKAELGVTVHGLRHEYANDRYEEVSGTPSVVRGSSEILDRAAEQEALRAVSNELGHARLAITGSYLGPRKRGNGNTDRPMRPVSTACATPSVAAEGG